MNTKSDIEAVVVTRGTRGIRLVTDALAGFKRTAVWDNSVHPNLKIFGRYVAVSTMTSTPLVYVQDDDLTLDDGGFEALMAAWRPGSIALNFPAGNRRNYEGVHGNVALVGFGAIFERQLIGKAFGRYLAQWPLDDLFLRECDRVFTALNSWIAVDTPKHDLPWAGGSDTMEAEGRHGEDLRLIKERIAGVWD